MKSNLFGAVLAFILGAAVAALNYFISRRRLTKDPARYSSVTLVRQLVQVIFLVLLFFLGGYTPWDRLWLLVGGCLGITVPMSYFTYRLVKLNDSMNSGKEDDADE